MQVANSCSLKIGNPTKRAQTGMKGIVPVPLSDLLDIQIGMLQQLIEQSIQLEESAEGAKRQWWGDHATCQPCCDSPHPHFWPPRFLPSLYLYLTFMIVVKTLFGWLIVLCADAQ